MHKIAKSIVRLPIKQFNLLKLVQKTGPLIADSTIICLGETMQKFNLIITLIVFTQLASAQVINCVAQLSNSGSAVHLSIDTSSRETAIYNTSPNSSQNSTMKGIATFFYSAFSNSSSYSLNGQGLAISSTGNLTVSGDDPTDRRPCIVEAPYAMVTLFPLSAGASQFATQDTNSIEVGMKFQTTTAGKVYGIRFLKGAGNTGTHVGSLWSKSGTLLGSVTFSDETTSGWQQANFTTPISVSANTTYVVSYHSDSGNYGYTPYYFTTTAPTSGSLKALKSGVEGGNGVFAYGSGPRFPTSSSLDANYWVDVVFGY